MAAVLFETQTSTQHPIHELSEDQWQQVVTGLHADTKDYWDKMAPHFVNGLRPDDVKPTPERVQQKEEAFFTNVHDAAVEMGRKWDTVVLLPDADFSTVEKLDDEWVMRPAFPWVVSVLSEELGENEYGESRLEVGALTTRGMSGYREGAPLPDYMASYEEKVNRDYLLSSREVEQSEPEIEGYRRWKGSLEDKLALVDRVVDHKIIDATRNGEIDLHTWFDTKLIMLQRLVEDENNCDRSFVYIEDFIGARVLDHPQIAGVHVFREQQNLTADQVIPAHVEIEAVLARRQPARDLLAA